MKTSEKNLELEERNFCIDAHLSREEKVANGWKKLKYHIQFRGKERIITVLKKLGVYEIVSGLPQRYIGEQFFDDFSFRHYALINQKKVPTQAQYEEIFKNYSLEKKSVRYRGLKFSGLLWLYEHGTFAGVGDESYLWCADGTYLLVNKNEFSNPKHYPNAALPFRCLKD